MADATGRTRIAALVVAAAAGGLAGCPVQVQNLRPAQELAAQQNTPPGSVYLGWRVYTEKCAACHGPAAGGTAQAPELTTRMADMSPRRFAHLVLLRYDLDASAAPATPAGPARARDDAAERDARDARIDDILQRRERALQMPAWQGEPRVNAHILDLYAYLAARAEGRQGPGRPPP
ncbi:MAG: c-type cytochrome [Rubrivivax sp.]|nr:c-type cytochrome [Rubrivivax sp.]